MKIFGIYILLTLAIAACRNDKIYDIDFFITTTQGFAKAVAKNKGADYFDKIASPDCFFLSKSGEIQDYKKLKEWYKTDTTSYEFVNTFSHKVIRQSNLVYSIYSESVKKKDQPLIDTNRYIEIYSFIKKEWKLSVLIALAP